MWQLALAMKPGTNLLSSELEPVCKVWNWFWSVKNSNGRWIRIWSNNRGFACYLDNASVSMKAEGLYIIYWQANNRILQEMRRKGHWAMTVCWPLLATFLDMEPCTAMCIYLLCTHRTVKAITNGRNLCTPLCSLIAMWWHLTFYACVNSIESFGVDPILPQLCVYEKGYYMYSHLQSELSALRKEKHSLDAQLVSVNEGKRVLLNSERQLTSKLVSIMHYQYGID